MSRRGLPLNRTLAQHHESASARSSASITGHVRPLSGGLASRIASPSPSAVSATTNTDPDASELALPEMMDSQKLYKAFLDAQKKIVELQEENKRLKALNLDLNMGAVMTKRGRTKAGKKASGGIECSESPESAGFRDFATNVQKLGQHHQLFWCVILEVSHFSPETRPEWAWDDFEIRFSTSELQKRGPSAELYVALPQEYHDIMALAATSSPKVNFVSKFRNAMSQSRSSSLMSLRNNAVLIFDYYGLSAQHFESKYDREKVGKIRELLGCTIDPTKKSTEYARIPPVICKDDDPSNVSKRFLNPVLFKVARGVIFGKSAINSKSAAVGRATSQYLRPGKYAQTTVGLISWVAMMTRYILSKDTIFDQTGVGNHTKIPYYADYDFYKHWILRAKSRKPDWATSLFAKWDAEIFSEHNKSSASTPDSECEVINLAGDADEIARDMEDLEINDSDKENFTGHLSQNALHPVQVHPDFDHNFDDIYDDVPTSNVGQGSQLIVDDSSSGLSDIDGNSNSAERLMHTSNSIHTADDLNAVIINAESSRPPTNARRTTRAHTSVQATNSGPPVIPAPPMPVVDQPRPRATRSKTKTVVQASSDSSVIVGPPAVVNVPIRPSKKRGLKK